MWIVRLALRRPYTFVVMAMLIAILGIYAIFNMSTDIFPKIDIPICSVVWNYSGLIPEEMEHRLISSYERALYSTVNDIEHVESQTINGMSVVRVFFQPNAHVEQGIAQVTAISQAVIRQAPPGTTPPLILRFSASNVPILQLGLGSDSLSEADLFDIANNFLRTDLATVPGAMVPWPYGGKQKQVMVDLDPDKLQARGVSPNDVSVALNSQNVVLPSGTAKIGTQEYPILVNNTPDAVEELNELPIKTLYAGTPQVVTVKLKDVAHVRMGFAPQTSIVHTNGKRGALLPIIKSPEASTLDIVSGVLDLLPTSVARLPGSLKALKVTPMFDQSIYVRAAVNGVVKEAAIAAGLTGLMILLFLGSWRSTLIVVISIPLSILVSIIILWLLGHTLNVMTLGGMALAVGILVDDATVEIENIHRNLHQRKRLVQAILDGAQQIAVPAFVSTLCICIVFVPVAFIAGASRFLFTPMAMAVVFAMMTSYLLSRTLVPTMVHYLLAAEVERYGGVDDPDDPHCHPSVEEPSPAGRALGWARDHRQVVAVGAALLVAIVVVAVSLAAPGAAKAVVGFLGGHWVAVLIVAALLVGIYFAARHDRIWRTHHAFNRQFEKFRRVYGGFLTLALEHKGPVVLGFGAFVLASCLLLPFVGRDFFPQVDAGQIRLHVRCPSGTRVEETERYFAKVEEDIRGVIPQHEVKTVLDNMGIPVSSINLSMGDPSMMSSADGEIMISLTEDHRPTADYVKTLREKLPQDFPECTFFFLPADITTQVLNFGLPAPIDIQVEGSSTTVAESDAFARKLAREVATVPGAVDVHVHQVTDVPELKLNVDRVMASQLGLTQKDIGNSMLVTLSGSGVVAPNYYVNPTNGVQYLIAVQTPQYDVNSIDALNKTPLVPGAGGAAAGAEANPFTASQAQLLGNLAEVSRTRGPANVSHYNVHPTFDVLAGVQGTDLASVSSRVRRIVDRYKSQKDANGKSLLPKGTTVTVRGQVQSMSAAFKGLGGGLVFAVVLVYLLMVVNFQSWLDPLIILMALPGALAGILWMLFITHTTLSVPSLMGAIMAIGVATANSILMITFANDQRKAGLNAHDAALAAGLTRLRPVVMTALAMIIGMLPMSLGLGEGGEQNAPLGRAVIGGLLIATFSTLFFVPIVYSVLRHRPPETRIEPELREATD